MSIEFQLPNLGEGVDSADIAEILVSEGETISADQVVMELETDKAVVELPCPHAGLIGKLLVNEGDTISVGQPLFVIEPAEAASRPEPSAARGGHAGERSAEASSGDAASGGEKNAPTDVGQESAAMVALRSSSTGEANGVIELRLPNIGEGVDSADIAEVRVAEGDTISAGQVVMDLETDKAVVELPCEQGGTVAKLHVRAGDTVRVGQTLLTISGRSTGEGALPDSRKGGASAENSSLPSRAISVPGPSQANGESPRAAERTPEKAPSRTLTAELLTQREEGGSPVPAAPSTRRLARQLGVNLRDVGGTGPGGRITQEDVQGYVKGQLQSARSTPARGSELAVMAAGSLAPPPLPDFSKFGVVERERMNKLSRTAAENLAVSWNVIPHVTQHDRADVTELEAARKKFANGAGASGPKVTMTAIVIKALATCLQQYPKFNSSLDPETMEIVYKRYYHIGCAVDTPHGLLVPVVRDVDKKSIRDVAGEINELAAQARDRKLPLEAMQGATCTVTNLGGIGGVGFTPIVNYPEVCILGLARGQQELRLDEGELSQRLMLPMSLSYDHRVINGADAARFLVSLGTMLSDPFQLLSAI